MLVTLSCLLFSPSWLLQDPNMQLRTTYKGFTEAVDAYFDHLMARVVPHQASRMPPPSLCRQNQAAAASELTRATSQHQQTWSYLCEKLQSLVTRFSLLSLQYKKGGPIIALQVENEYGSYAKDHHYLTYIKMVTLVLLLFPVLVPPQSALRLPASLLLLPVPQTSAETNAGSVSYPARCCSWGRRGEKTLLSVLIQNCILRTSKSKVGNGRREYPQYIQLA